MEIVRWCRWSVAGFAFAISAAAASGQGGQPATGGFRGVIRDQLGAPVGGAQISIAGSDMRGETDGLGEFAVTKANVGTLTIRVRRIGFRPDSTTVMVRAGESSPVEIVLTRFAVDLRPVVVNGRKELTGEMAGFYERRSHGFGHFYTREEIEKQNLSNMTDLFRMLPGAHVESRGSFQRVVRFRGSRCAPLTVLDGMGLFAGEFDLDALDPRSFEGIEVYSGPASVPVRFQGNRNISSSCGTIVLWSRQGELRPKRRKNGSPSPAAEIAKQVEDKSVFTASEVDVPARPDSTALVHPVYPDSLLERGLPGRVLAEFVVSASGEVVIETFSVVTATNDAFAESVRRVVHLQRYLPAQRKGQAVQQVVQQPFEFVPDPAAVRKR